MGGGVDAPPNTYSPLAKQLSVGRLKNLSPQKQPATSQIVLVSPIM